MAARCESADQLTTATWVASGAPSLVLENIGYVTRYDIIHEMIPSATLVGANQPDGLYRPFMNVQISTGNDTYYTLPSVLGGQGGVLLALLNRLDGFGAGHTTGGITAPDRLFVPVKLTFHAGVYPKRNDGRDNPYDLSGFVPVGPKGTASLVWTTDINSTIDDTVTLSSGVLRVTAHRVVGNKQEIMDLMRAQRLSQMMQMAGVEALVPAWQTNIESPTATWSDYGYVVDAKPDGFLTRQTWLAQNDSASLGLRAQDELTQLALYIPGESTGKYYFKVSTNVFTTNLPIMQQLSADDASVYGGAAPKGFYPVDLRVWGAETDLERVLGKDLRNKQGAVKQSGYMRWGMTIGTNATGDDILGLSERRVGYNGPW